MQDAATRGRLSQLVDKIRCCVFSPQVGKISPRVAKGSPFGGAGERSETERARVLTARLRRSDSIALTKSLPIAVQRLCRDRLALSVCFADTSPKGRGFRPFPTSCDAAVAGFPPQVGEKLFRNILRNIVATSGNGLRFIFDHKWSKPSTLVSTDALLFFGTSAESHAHKWARAVVQKCTMPCSRTVATSCNEPHHIFIRCIANSTQVWKRIPTCGDAVHRSVHAPVGK